MTDLTATRFLWPSALLHHIPLEHTTDRDEAVNIVAGKFASHTLRPLRDRVKLSMRSSSYHDLTVHVMDYGVPIIVEATLLESCYILVIPTSGQSRVKIGARSWEFDPKSPILLPPDREFSLTFNDKCTQLLVTIPTFRMESVLAAFFGGDSVPSVREPVFGIQTSAGRALILEIKALYEEVNSGAIELMPEPLTVNTSDAFIARLVNAFFNEDVPKGAMKGLRRNKIVHSFIDLAQADKNLNPIEAAVKLNIPLRTLQELVKEELNLTPVQVINRSRLERARKMLTHANPAETSVTKVAYASGFKHIGRFSVQYRQLFNEKPSDTLRRV